jgi:hypothetical protein
VGVHIRLVVLLCPASWAGPGLCGVPGLLAYGFGKVDAPVLGRSEDADAAEGVLPEDDGGKGEDAARVEPTAPIQRKFTATTIGPGSGSGIGCEMLLRVCWVSPRLTRRPDIRAGLNWVVDCVL